MKMEEQGAGRRAAAVRGLTSLYQAIARGCQAIAGGCQTIARGCQAIAGGHQQAFAG